MTAHADGVLARSKNVRYLPGVDHLRALAALLIVVYHGVQQISGRPFPRASDPASALVFEGHTAVALFMVLSGFILTFGADLSPVRYGAFMRNRVLRVVPMYLVVLLVGMYTFPGQYSIGGVWQYLTLQATPPFDVAQFGAWSALLWTVSIEFQFYLLFPFLLRFLQRYGVRYLLGVLALTNVLRLMSAASNRASIRDLSYFSIVGRLDQFVLGMLGAWLIRRGTVRLTAGRAWMALGSGSAAVLGAIWAFNRNGSFLSNAPWKAPWPLLEGGAWAIFVVAYVVLSERWSGRWIRWVAFPGIVSYSVYLVHFVFVDLVVRRHWHVFDSSRLNAAALTVAVVLPATLAVATLSYLVIERPFMQLRVRYVADQPPQE
jgi:peptidoglycan/LPS O-acetylase OafA/YrhL